MPDSLCLWEFDNTSVCHWQRFYVCSSDGFRDEQLVSRNNDQLVSCLSHRLTAVESCCASVVIVFHWKRFVFSVDQRKQQDVQRENQFHLQLLQDALPLSAITPPPPANDKPKGQRPTRLTRPPSVRKRYPAWPSFFFPSILPIYDHGSSGRLTLHIGLFHLLCVH